MEDTYKSLCHDYQLIVTNNTNVRDISNQFHYEMDYQFTHLNNIENLPLNSIIS